ncbi:MerR family transcriptional regulator [Arthrobacter sp. I2-34]|uniref:MerR family transcriptional regulator n=1 Tax=Arthrobacter hankyongi TaxID=2904801 RepID=A0ABS9LEI4_9MICC|nr:MerR family transcriptional regulator [Arthrobacter hankyongi]MCG2624862.1 MerR family transcriptional regulator [Arthrobacter hankyongi]
MEILPARKEATVDSKDSPRSSRGVYGISVAADLVGMAQPTLRLYERKGLVEPERTSGGTRRYSDEDLERLRRIGELVDAGVNLAGVDLVLHLEADNVRLRQDLAEARRPDREEHREEAEE